MMQTKKYSYAKQPDLQIHLFRQSREKPAAPLQFEADEKSKVCSKGNSGRGTLQVNFKYSSIIIRRKT